MGKYRKQKVKIMMYTLHHMVSSFSHCLTFEIMYIRFISVYKKQRDFAKRTSTAINYQIIPLFEIFLTKFISSDNPLSGYSGRF